MQSRWETFDYLEADFGTEILIQTQFIFCIWRAKAENYFMLYTSAAYICPPVHTIKQFILVINVAIQTKIWHGEYLYQALSKFKTKWPSHF